MVMIECLTDNPNRIFGDDAELFDKFLDMLNDLDDVQNIYHKCYVRKTNRQSACYQL